MMLQKLLFSSLMLAVSVHADVPVHQVEEVEHLFSFIRNSDCILERNGSQHAAQKAVKHIRNKYDYFRDEIKSTEGFIRLSASKSTISGEYYKVQCPGEKKMNTQDWLLMELKRYRSS